MNNESGRSLVEILGVLAIIGVLSIAGIAGYKLAIYRYTASKIIDTTNKYAFIVFERCRAVYDSHSTALQSIDSCTKNTPGVPKFSEAGIGIPPDGLLEEGILFNRVSKESNSHTHIIQTTLQFKTKDHCLAVKYMQNIQNGCRQTSAPYTLSFETSEN